MLDQSDLRKGIKIIVDGEPYEILETTHIKKARGQATVQTKMKNLISGNNLSRSFHQGDSFQEAELSKFTAKHIYSHREEYFFSEESNHQKRFSLTEEQIGSTAKFLKPNLVVEGIIFEEKIINISLPIKVKLKVAEAPPGIRGDRAQGGTKTVTLESGAKINVPLFVEQEDTVEVNTETEEYVRRVE